MYLFFNGKLDIIYGSSLGGSYVGHLIARENIHIRQGILGSSDLDQSNKFMAKLNQKIANPIAYNYLHKGRVPAWVRTLMIRFKGKAYTEAALKMMGIGGINMSFVSEESCFNQDYYDAVTPLPNNTAAF